MQDKITVEEGSLVIRIPMKTTRCNPYDEAEHSEMENNVGIIEHNRWGFAHLIDFAYKDKPDQTTDLFYEYYGSEEDFIKLCDELHIDCIKMPWCIQCQHTIYGVHTICAEGNLCLECAEKLKL